VLVEPLVPFLSLSNDLYFGTELETVAEEVEADDEFELGV
jgi:hypothetical protein